MSDRTLYFTFPDATFAYECRSCGNCCKGLGVGLDAVEGEHEALVDRYPELAPFLKQQGGAWMAKNPRGGCWFLQDDGLCRVEVDHGRSAKPAACRLFPFNRVFALGEVTIVDFNSVICPLHALPPGESTDMLSGRVAHANIRADIASIADPKMVATPLETASNDADGRRFASREGRLAKAAFSAFRADDPDIDAVLAEKLPRRVRPPRLRREVASAYRTLFEREPRLPGLATTRNALALTPSMRFNELYGPRQYGTRASLQRALPAMWLAWLHFLADAETLAERQVTLQQATSIWVDQAPLSYTLACWEQIPTLEPGPVALSDDPDVRQRLLALGESCAQNKRQTLGALIEAQLPDAVVARAAFVREAEDVLGKLEFK